MKNYDYIGLFFVGFARVCLNKKYGFIDINGNEICECKYDEVWNFYKCYALIRTDDHCGFININGVEVVECRYSFNNVYLPLEKYKYNQKRIQKLKTII